MTDQLQQYVSYPFHSDEAFQKGLEGILADAATSGPIRDDIVRRARVFYFNRITGRSITIDQARQAEEAISSFNVANVGKEELQGVSPFVESSAASTQENKNAEEEPNPLTFAELQELIESGREDLIPNNKTIPDGLSDNPPSSSTAPIRKKPWEIRVMESRDLTAENLAD